MRWADSLPGAVLKWMRNGSLRAAKMNAVLHDTMADHLRSQGVADRQICVLQNWADARIRPIPHEQNPLRAEWRLGRSFVIGYSGNLGRAHMPEAIAELITRTRSIDHLKWLFIGSGHGLVRLKTLLNDKENVVFQPYQPRERLSESLSAADAHLVSLIPACEGLIVPSKFYGILAVDRPAIFLGSPVGAIAREITRLGKGIVLDVARPDLWKAEVEKLCQAERGGQRNVGANAQAANDTSRKLASWSDAVAQLLPQTARVERQ